MPVVLGGMAASQYLLNLADTNSFVLFALASVLVSMALVPISVSPTPTPDFTAPEPLGLRALYRISPLGTIGALGTGMANAAPYSMAAVYAGTVGLTVPQIAVCISANLLGGLVFQRTLGRRCDKLDSHRGVTGGTFHAQGAAVLENGREH